MDDNKNKLNVELFFVSCSYHSFLIRLLNIVNVVAFYDCGVTEKGGALTVGVEYEYDLTRCRCDAILVVCIIQYIHCELVLYIHKRVIIVKLVT